MSQPCRTFLPLLACLAVTLLVGAAQAQQPNYNAAVLGGGMPQLTTAPGYAAFNPAPTYGPALANVAAPAYSSPYALNTAPAYAGGYYPPYYGGLGRVGGALAGYGQALQGNAALTSANADYWKSMQTAALQREGVRQESLNTARKQLEFEAWYEGFRNTAPKMRDKEMRADLDWARKDPPKTEIWSGRSLNTLLQSVLGSPSPTRGPNIALDPEVLRGINLTDGTTRNNLALAKDEGKIAWPEVLDDAAFDQPRDRFAKNFEKATKAATTGEAPDRATLRELRDDLQVMDRKLDDKASDFAPSRWIEARRLLTKLKENVAGLSNPRLCKACQSNWRSGVRSVADLVGYCMKNGLQFGPASAEGDEPSYTATFYAMRSYERDLVHSLTARSQ